MQLRGLIRFTAIAVAMSLMPAVHAEPLLLRIRSPFFADHSSSRAVEIFRSELASRTHGAADVEFAPLGPGGGVKDLVDELRTDSIFAFPAPMPYLSRLVPETDALSLPFVFMDADHARQATSGAVGKLIESKLAAKGFIPLGWMALGARHVANSRRPLTTLNDFKGLKVRVQPSEIHMATFRALGASPVAMDIKDVYTALQQGDIDAYEGPYQPMYNARYYEVQKYISDTGHVFELLIFIASRKTFAGLPPDQQKAVRDAARIATDAQWKMAARMDEDGFAGLRASGMQFDPVPATTRAAFRQALTGVIDGARKRLGGDLVDQVIAAGAIR